MKKSIIVGLCMAAGLGFITYAFVKSSPAPRVVTPPVLNESPARVYGIIEPAGREVFVSPPVTKEVVAIYVKEGDTVTRGKVLCSLDNDVEHAAVQLAKAKVAAARRALAISRDDVKRKKRLYSKEVDSEFSYTQSFLRMELDASNLEVARKDMAVAQARFDQLDLKAPIDGIVYKFDVRTGETLSAGDNSRIILGPANLWVRLFVESYWIDRIKPGARYKIYQSETTEYLGEGEVIYQAPYMGRRNFRTEDVQERFDTKFQEVVLLLQQEKDTIPIGLSVVAELSPEQGMTIKRQDERLANGQ